jgi:hypothetical protein
MRFIADQDDASVEAAATQMVDGGRSGVTGSDNGKGMGHGVAGQWSKASVQYRERGFDYDPHHGSAANMAVRANSVRCALQSRVTSSPTASSAVGRQRHESCIMLSAIRCHYIGRTRKSRPGLRWR